ncbi:hypothetical protein PXW82_00500 [Klebsiella pneumoniae]|uniref:hypothetical protein n=1 Tax=Klebsiella pneumoniae TaxID=573 RepID=UPI0023818F96|nr:hypothetical protein [Klebsiella pneumoniae]MDE4771806.1 hypothetical protein [Klebsiella pneumoniae]
MKKLLIVALGAVLLTGCTTPARNYVPQTKQISIPPLNTVTTTYVGEDMVRQGIDASIDAIHFNQAVVIGSIGVYTIPAGDYVKIGEDSKSEFYSNVERTSGVVVPNRFMVNDPTQSIQLMKNGEICIVTIYGGTKCDTGKPFTKVKFQTEQQSSFQQTLIYNGKVGNKINIGYREFQGGMARAAFSNEVEYDLSESKTIRYKGAVLDIMDANNQSITFKLTRNFNTN